MRVARKCSMERSESSTEYAIVRPESRLVRSKLPESERKLPMLMGARWNVLGWWGDWSIVLGEVLADSNLASKCRAA